jgi:hypothetical protein
LALFTAMNHLIRSEDLNRIENQLLLRRDQLVQATAWTFNLALLALVLATFVFFLYTQYNSTAQEEKEQKRIPFTPVTWYSATRNVRNEEYGQTPSDQTGYGLPEPTQGRGTEAFYGT